MPDRKLSAKQRAVMLVLMAEGRELSNTEMNELHGLRLTGSERERLDDQGLVTSSRSGNGPFVLELTDPGWRWCADELAAGRPNASRQESLGKALYAVLAGIGRYLEDAERGLADVFSCAPAESVEDRIRAIHRKLAERPGDYVSLTDLRQELNGVPRAETDKALLRLNREKGVTLAPEEDQKLLTDHDRAAALCLGTQDVHLLAIESS
ncbi:hypothetical protein DMH03_09575 [Amycolatopsis sp. WAC 01376]|uniref:hypothetical protein n=1 Tax=Amycolatopsis sp. WAC 01376 TaxID=2203195 RepID=UPI000F7A2986|nr:hypothetical protein [Amycolatopsis sp. WAC 01376]RSM62357.1 hypothetical protein DMH03_09575 [Amycolatopsis sp. WAC 01376]